MAQESSSKHIAQDVDIVQQKLLEEGYTFPMASHHVSEQKVWNFFKALFDGNEYAAAGACGNMQHESGLYSDNAENEWNRQTGHSDEWLTTRINNYITQTSPNIDLATFLQRSWWVNNWGFGYGLSQWTDTTRRTRLWNRTIDQGITIDNEDAQLGYIGWEFTDGPYSSYRQGMINCTSVEEATRYYLQHYEVGAWNESRLVYANYFYDTYAEGAGGNSISVTATGNGTAYVDNPFPQDGEQFTLFAIPATGETLEDITATDTHGYYIAMSVVQQYTYTYNETSWGNHIDIYVEFSGETPVPPTPAFNADDEHHMPIWMYPFMRC